MKKTKYNGIEITFDDMEYQKLEDCFECRGYDDNGNKYSGLVIKSCGEYLDITDIEILKTKDLEQVKNQQANILGYRGYKELLVSDGEHKQYHLGLWVDRCMQYYHKQFN